MTTKHFASAVVALAVAVIALAPMADAQTPNSVLGYTNPAPATLSLAASGPSYILPINTYQMISAESNIFLLYGTTNTFTNLWTPGSASAFQVQCQEYDDVGLCLDMYPNLTNRSSVTVALSRTYNGGSTYETTPTLIWTMNSYNNTTNQLTTATNLAQYLSGGADGFEIDYITFTATDSGTLTNAIDMAVDLKSPKYGWRQSTQ